MVDLNSEYREREVQHEPGCADTTTKYGTKLTKLQDSPTCATANIGARAKNKPGVMQLCTRNLFC